MAIINGPTIRLDHQTQASGGNRVEPRAPTAARIGTSPALSPVSSGRFTTRVGEITQVSFLQLPYTNRSEQ